MASQDMNHTISAKTRVDEMLTAVKAYNQRIDDDLVKISTTGDEISAAVGVAIRSLQFEDVVTQVVGYSDSHVMRLNELVHRLHSKITGLRQSGQSIQSSQLQQMIQQFQTEISEMKAEWAPPLNKAVSQQSMAEGDIEFF